MHTQRGNTSSGGFGSQYQMTHKTMKSSGSGSQTQRTGSGRAEWAKPTTIHSSKPLNLHKSIDSKPL